MLGLLACSKSSGVTPDPVTPPTTTPPEDTTKQPPKDTAIVLPAPATFTVEAVNTNGPNITQYLLYLPDGYNNDPAAKWPVVIYLHGQGEMGTDISVLRNSSLPRMVKGKPFILVVPQCTAIWWNMDALEAFYKVVLSRYRIDAGRIYLTGISMGGIQTWDWAEKYPAHFAAIMPIAGNGDVKLAANIRNMPVWAFHSADDPRVGVAGSRNIINALRELGNPNVKYTEYATGGHDAWTRAYSTTELYTWLLAQKK
ncbi:phospholipase [Chitinophaga qingshengii]|uniref:Phospholipase n=1 Tax=Chitinophaga qingshengii TaxID=1569794 RepID=A0ABR7TMM8_9BACT|nr:phospholipase [Chitinophaga qingshengii]MBC9930793.1 phospholipase [Chitinophaga qingshengii]